MRHLLAPVLAIAALALLSPAPAPADETDELFARSLADAKDLAANALPTPEALGPDWRRPWELPKTAELATPAASGAAAIDSEEKYWERYGMANPPTGLTEAYARQFIDDFAAKTLEIGGSQGATARDGIVMALSMFRGVTATTAQKAREGARMLELVSELLTRQRLGTVPTEGLAGARGLIDVLTKQYASLDDAALKDLFVKDVTRVVKRTRMEYFRSNDWEGLRKAKTDDEIAKAGVWLEAVTIAVSLIASDRIGEMPDEARTKEEAEALRAEIARGFSAYVRALEPVRRPEVQARVDRATSRRQSYDRPPEGSPTSEDLARREREIEAADRELARAKEELANVGVPPTVFVKSLGHGENCYSIRIQYTGPDIPGLSLALYTGWMRNGRAVAEVSFAGNAPAAVMEKDMEEILKAVLGTTSVYME